MRFSQFLPKGALCLAAFAGVLGAQNIAVLTGSQGSNTVIPIYSASSLAPQASVSPVPQGAFQLLAEPHGTKFYLLSNSSGLTVLDRNLANPRQVLTSLNAAPTKAAFSPDGRRLFVIAGSFAYFIDTATDTLLNGGGGITVTGTPRDVAFSQDSLTAYILSNGAFTAYVTPVDLNTFLLGTSLQLPVNGIATAIATGPNGLLYVSAPNGLFEINPRTLTINPGSDVTQAATIPVPGTNPGALQFTSDGQYAIALNRTTGGAPVIIFNLGNHTALSVSAANLNGATLDQVVVAGSRIFVHSSLNQLLELSLGGGLTTSPILIQFPSGSTVQSILPSPEIPAKSLFVVATANGVNTLYKVDLATNTLVVPQSGVAIPNQSGQILAYTGVNPTSGAAAISGFNSNQTISTGATSLPLVARVVDLNGVPVFGATVTFTVQNAGVVLSGSNGTSSSTVTTNSNGYAQVYATAGQNPGTATVQASSGNIAGPAYTITIPGNTVGGCTQNCTAAGVSIVSGNGQLVTENDNAPQLLLVVVKDANGNPLANQQVTFTSTTAQGAVGGSISCTGVGDTFPIIPAGACTLTTDPNTGLTNGANVITDAQGLAGVKYHASSTLGQTFVQTTVTAATATVGSVSFNETTLIRSLGLSASAYLIAPPADASGFRIVRGTAGQTIPGAIQFQVIGVVGALGSGTAIPGVALNVSSTGDPTKTPSATCAGAPITDSNGMVSCDLVLGPVVGGPTPVNVNIGGQIQRTDIFIQVSQGTATRINLVSGNNSSGKAGQQIVLKAQVTDANGNPVPGVPVSWAVTPQGSGTLGTTSQVSDAQGFVQSTITLAGGGGAASVRVTANPGTGGSFSATFNLTVTVSVGGITLVSGNNQNAVTGQQFAQPLVVKVTDTNGQPLANATVSFSVISGSAVFASPTALTDATGTASTTVTAGLGGAGPIAILASVGNQSTQFTLTSRLPGPSVDVTGFRNAASGAPGLSPCGIATVTGAGLAPGLQGTVEANSFVGPLPSLLSGVTIAVNGIPAPIFWVSNTQLGGEAVAFQTPCEVTPGPASVVITVNNGNTTISNVPVVKYQPGIFETVINGRKYAVLLHASDGSYVTPDNPARRGEQLKMFATGLGAGLPSTGTNRAGIGGQASAALITVGVNNAGVRVIGSEYLPGAIGIYEITFEVPADTTPGPYQNLGLVVADPTDPNLTPIYAGGSFLPIS